MFHLTLPAATHALAFMVILSTASPLSPATVGGVQIASPPRATVALHCRIYFGCAPTPRVTSVGAE